MTERMLDTKTYYTVSFTPAGAGAGAPDQLIYKGVSNIQIWLNGFPCVIKERGGYGSRKRRQKLRNVIKREEN